MGLSNYAAGALARSVNIAALQSVSGDLIVRVRMKIDALLGITGFNVAGIGQVDDGTDPNAKFILTMDDNGGPKRIRFVVPGGGGIDTGFIPITSWPAAGRYIVALLWHRQSVFDKGFAIYDDTGTGTLVDGLPPGTSIFQGTASLNATFPVIAGNGQVAVNYASGGGSIANVIDSFLILNTLPAADALPLATSASVITGWLFDDALTATTYANYKSGGVVLTPSGTVTLTSGGAETAAVSTPTSISLAPVSPGIAVAGTVTIVATTLDQFGAAMPGRTHAFVSGTTAHATVGASTGVVTGVAAGSSVISVTDTSSGGGAAGTATDTVTVGTTYDWSSSASGVASVGTGSATEPITDVAAGSATITVTRHGTSASCTISVVCAGAGVGNEPSGMTPGINTGDMVTAPSQVSGGTWNEGSIIVTQFTNNTQGPGSGDAAVGAFPNNVLACPDGPGMRTQFLTSLRGGNQPVSLSCGINQPSGTKLGVLYGKALIRFVNWSNTGSSGADIGGVKVIEPRCGQSSENHVIEAVTTSHTDNYLGVTLQGVPLGGAENYPRTDITFTLWNSATAYVPGNYVKLGSGAVYVCILSNTNQTPPNATFWTATSGQFQTIDVYAPNSDLLAPAAAFRGFEYLLGQETTPGVSGDAYIKLWVAGTLAFDSTILGTWSPSGAFNMLNPSSTKGWPALVFNQTFGGAADTNHPKQTQFLDLNQLYASSK